MPEQRIAVIIPARNEEACLADCITSLEPFRAAGDLLCVIDAFSSDKTPQIAHSLQLEVIQPAQPDRSAAIRAGVEWAKQLDPAPLAILIAHADMKFQQSTRTAIFQALEQTPESPGGCLGHRIDDQRFMFRMIEWGNRIRARRLQMPYGDQAQFFRLDALARIGGFPPVERLEDVELSLRMRALGPLLCLDCPVTIPSRHWRNGIIRTTLRNWLTVMRYSSSRPR